LYRPRPFRVDLSARCPISVITTDDTDKHSYRVTAKPPTLQMQRASAAAASILPERIHQSCAVQDLRVDLSSPVPQDFVITINITDTAQLIDNGTSHRPFQMCRSFCGRQYTTRKDPPNLYCPRPFLRVDVSRRLPDLR
jgi:hypothetical protein